MSKNDKSKRNKNGLFEVPKKATAETLGYIIGAFGLIAALAWNEAIKASINHFFKSEGNIISLFIYALIVTLIAVVVTTRLQNFSQKLNIEKKEEEK